MPTAPSQEEANLEDDLNLVFDFVSSLGANNIIALAGGLRSTDGAPQARVQTVSQHTGLIAKIMRYQAQKY